MINFNNVSEIQLEDKQVEQIAINGVVVWGQAVWYAPIPLGNNLYVRSVIYHTLEGTNLNLSAKGGEDS